MTRLTHKEFYTILAELRAEHAADFERWYDHAAESRIKDCAEMGFLLCRFYITLDKEEPNSATP